MFSVCEEPMVVSGGSALLFTWEKDTLWTKRMDNETDDKLTSFVLKMRDCLPLPDMVQLGQFLCKSLTFTRKLRDIRVFVDDKLSLHIKKTVLKAPSVLSPIAAERKDSEFLLSAQTPKGVFTLDTTTPSIFRSTFEISVQFEDQLASVEAEYIEAKGETHLPPELATKMERVTKKMAPPEVQIQILQPSIQRRVAATTKSNSKAMRIARTFIPSQVGSGRVFIGFVTSQTTGLAAHVGAPFYPTVEREAMDLQDPTLRLFNSELLSFCGIVLRLSLEQVMGGLGEQWLKNSDKETVETTDKPNKSMFAQVLDGIFGSSESASLLESGDDSPLSDVERQAVLLVKSFCPRPSTPEPSVGLFITNAFKACRPNLAPPVLTMTGVVPGNKARTPKDGLDRFMRSNVVRSSILKIASEYHQAAGCVPLCLNDLVHHLDKSILKTRSELVLLLTWWREYQTKHRFAQHGVVVPDSSMLLHRIRFRDESSDSSEDHVYSLKKYKHYNKLELDECLPVPKSVLPAFVQASVDVGADTFSGVWDPLSIEDWVGFIAKQDFMHASKANGTALRLKALAAMSRSFSLMEKRAKVLFGIHCKNHLGNISCIPVEDDDNGITLTAKPTDLFLDSAIVKAKNMQVASHLLKSEGISNEFLRAIGARDGVSVKAVINGLKDLDWEDDPKELFEYLVAKESQITTEDLQYLSHCRYLPAENDDTGCRYAPSELCLPDSELSLFPKVKRLKWNAMDDIHQYKYSHIVRFLVQKLGMREFPPIISFFEHFEEVKDEKRRITCLKYFVRRLRYGGDNEFRREYSKSLKGRTYTFLPGVRYDPLTKDQEPCSVLCSPAQCFVNKGCASMGFIVLDERLMGNDVGAIGSAFECQEKPNAEALRWRFQDLVRDACLATSRPDFLPSDCDRMVKSFQRIFNYLATRVFEFDGSTLRSFREFCRIPFVVGGTIEWVDYRQVLFQTDAVDPIAAKLFYFAKNNLFLAAVGVKEEPTNQDLLELVVNAPVAVLERLGSDLEYLALLRRISSNRSFTPDDRVGGYRLMDCEFLLAYTTDSDGDDFHSQYRLAKPSEVHIVDNTSYSRLFNVTSAPSDVGLERFYSSVGSKYLSNEVSKRYSVKAPKEDTPAVTALRMTISKRKALLVCQSNTSRPLVDNATLLLQDDELKIEEAEEIVVTYSMRRSSKSSYRKETTCCVKPTTVEGTKHSLFITRDFEWFDVGSAISELILCKTHVEDAFFVGMLLSTPLEQLKAKGFPVDQAVARSRPVANSSEAAPSLISDSLVEAAQVAVTQLSNLGAATAFFSGAGDNNKGTSFSWFGTGSNSMLKRSIEPEGDSLDSPLLDDSEQESDAPMESVKACATSSTTSDATKDKCGFDDVVLQTDVVPSYETNKKEEAPVGSAVDSAHEDMSNKEPSGISYVMDWL